MKNFQIQNLGIARTICMKGKVMRYIAKQNLKVWFQLSNQIFGIFCNFWLLLMVIQ